MYNFTIEKYLFTFKYYCYEKDVISFNEYSIYVAFAS
jgi:hypothetical protein